MNKVFIFLIFLFSYAPLGALEGSLVTLGEVELTEVQVDVTAAELVFSEDRVAETRVRFNVVHRRRTGGLQLPKNKTYAALRNRSLEQLKKQLERSVYPGYELTFSSGLDISSRRLGSLIGEKVSVWIRKIEEYQVEHQVVDISHNPPVLPVVTPRPPTLPAAGASAAGARFRRPVSDGLRVPPRSLTMERERPRLVPFRGTCLLTLSRDGARNKSVPFCLPCPVDMNVYDFKRFFTANMREKTGVKFKHGDVDIRYRANGKASCLESGLLSRIPETSRLRLVVMVDAFDCERKEPGRRPVARSTYRTSAASGSGGGSRDSDWIYYDYFLWTSMHNNNGGGEVDDCDCGCCEGCCDFDGCCKCGDCECDGCCNCGDCESDCCCKCSDCDCDCDGEICFKVLCCPLWLLGELCGRDD